MVSVCVEFIVRALEVVWYIVLIDLNAGEMCFIRWFLIIRLFS